tara:strand:+ start:4671 stop:4943 length:273 start_codon:yes stop_codon:yes gene_type:complete
MKNSTEAHRVLAIVLERSPKALHAARKVTFLAAVERGADLRDAARSAFEVNEALVSDLADEARDLRNAARRQQRADVKAAKARIAARKDS